METMETGTEKDRALAGGKARHRRLSEARAVLIYDPVTKETTHAEW